MGMPIFQTDDSKKNSGHLDRKRGRETKKPEKVGLVRKRYATFSCLGAMMTQHPRNFQR